MPGLVQPAQAQSISPDSGAAGSTVRAQIKAGRQTVIAATAAGVLTKLDAKEGQIVREGTVIASIDCTSQRAARKMSAAKLEAASAKSRVNADLAKNNAVSVLEVEVSKAEMNMAQAELEGVDVAIRKCDIHAPFDAVVVNRPANPFQFIREGEPLYELVGYGNLEIEMVVPAGWLVWLKPGSKFALDMEETGQHRMAVVDRLGGRVDPVSQTVRVLGRFSDGGKDLLPGMSGIVRFADADIAAH
ncbi:MAG TPA: efflux RND transporter periplasmic adaptor subunit [Alphaproteobacteria bacterium]